MDYRREEAVTEIRRDNGPTDIRGTLETINALLGEAYFAGAAVMGFLFGDTPVQEVTGSNEPSCFAGDLYNTQQRVDNLKNLFVTMAKRLGA